MQRISNAAEKNNTTTKKAKETKRGNDSTAGSSKGNLRVVQRN
jgi:hypothetical protein